MSTWLVVKVSEYCCCRCIVLHFMVVIIHSYTLLFAASVVEQLEHGDFFSEKITKRRLFASVHDAVLHCLNHRGATTIPRYEPSVVRPANIQVSFSNATFICLGMDMLRLTIKYLKHFFDYRSCIPARNFKAFMQTRGKTLSRRNNEFMQYQFITF